MTWLQANGLWLRWALVSLAAAGAVLGVHCYGDRRASGALEMYSAHVHDSVGTVLEAQFAAKADSAAHQATAASILADSARAARAHADSVRRAARGQIARALATAAAVRDSVARASPLIRAAFDSLIAALDGASRALQQDSVALRAQAFAIDSLTAAQRSILDALGDARHTIAEKDTTIVDLKRIKTPRTGFLHTVGVAGRYVVAVLAGAGAERVFGK